MEEEIENDLTSQRFSASSDEEDSSQTTGRYVRPFGYIESRNPKSSASLGNPHEATGFLPPQNPMQRGSRINSTMFAPEMSYANMQTIRPGSLKFPKMQEKENAKDRQKEWLEYRLMLEAYFRLNPHITSTNEKLDLLTLNGGITIRDALRDFDRDFINSDDFESVLDFLGRKFNAGITTQGYLLEFWKTTQKENEGFIDFVRTLEELARDAGMKDDKEQSIILQAVRGARNSKRLNDPLVYYGKTLEEIKHLATQLEIDEIKQAQKPLAQVKKEEQEVTSEADVHYVNRGSRERSGHYLDRRSSRPNIRKRFHFTRGRDRFNYKQGREQFGTKGPTDRNQNRRQNGGLCWNCNKPGHFQRDCKVFNIRQDDDTKDDDKRMIEVRLGWGNSIITLMIDTGSEVNAITRAQWRKLKADKKCRLYDIRFGGRGETLRTYDGGKLHVIASFWTWIVTPGTNKSFEYFFVVDGAKVGLLEHRTAQRLNVVKLGEAECARKIHNVTVKQKLKEFPKIPGIEIKLSVDENVPPTRNCGYHIALALEDSTQQQLDELEEQNIIEPAPGDSPWMSELRVVEKGSANEEERQGREKMSDAEKASIKRRLVVDLRAVNRAVRRFNHPMPVLDNFLPHLKGAKCFTKLDLKNAFYHVALHESSRHLTAFMTKKGPRQFTCLPFGINCAPEIFQSIMEDFLRGCEGTIVFIDDILIYAATVEELKERTEAVLKVLTRNRLTINEEKCEYYKKEIDFLGYTLSENGIRPKYEKIQAIQNFRRPNSKTELKSFLGLVTYIGGSIESLAKKTALLRELTHINVRYVWETKHENAFQALKRDIGNNIRTRGYFDNDKTTVLYTDASPQGLGAVLAQRFLEEGCIKETTIECAAKSLTDSERRYPQTQREALAIVWAVERFSHYLIGREFIIVTDHQPLEFIFVRAKHSDKRSLTRAEGWALRLSNYRFTMEHIESKDNIADVPSRLCTQHDEPFDEKMENFGLCSVEISFDSLKYGDGRARITREIIRECTRNDYISQQIIHALKCDDWSTDELKPFEKIKEEFSVSHDIIIRRDRAVLPKSLQSIAVRIAHLSHAGTASMKRHLRSHFWWPNIDRDVDNLRASCETCVRMEKEGPPLPMKRTDIPDRPWQYLAIDFYSKESPFAFKIVVLQDYFSKYVKAAFIKNCDSDETTRFFIGACEDLELPEKLISDNGPPFQSASFNEFCKKRSISLVHSAPGNPRANGMIERFMQNIKRAIIAALIEKAKSVQDLKQVIKNLLFAYNRRPHSVTGKSPYELLHGRESEDIFPVMRFTDGDSEIAEKVKEIMLKGKEYQDQKTHARPKDIKVGDEVALLDFCRGKLDPTYKEGWHKVIRKSGADIFVNVNGKEFRRNLAHVVKRPENEFPTGEENEKNRSPNSSAETTSAAHVKPDEKVPDSLTRKRSIPDDAQEYGRGKRQRKPTLRYQ